MRVCLLTDADVFAGTERHMLDLASGLRVLGLEASIGCPAPSPLASRAEAAGITTIAIKRQDALDTAAIRILLRLLRSGAVDIIHSHNGRTALSASVAARLAGRGTHVTTQHFLAPAHTHMRGPKAAVFNSIHRWVNAHTQYFIAISEAVREGMLRRREAPESRITVVPNGLGVDESVCRPSELVRAELGFPTNAPLVVCVARLESEKDIATLVRAMSAVIGQQPDALAIIVGRGSQHDALASLCSELGVADHVRLVGFREDALALIGACDIFVLPSLAEPFGLVLLEAMALRKPVIATDAGGPREIVVPSETGLLVPPSDPAALASAILNLISNPQDRARMAQNGRDRYEKLYTVERMTQRTLAVYQKALTTKL